MPAFGPSGTYKWGDDKIAYALTYIRQEWGNAAGEITPEQVTAVKEATASQTAAYTAGDL
jgi:mono/diheme cytochrome c family protein